MVGLGGVLCNHEGGLIIMGALASGVEVPSVN